MPSPPELQALRQAIEEVDRELLALLRRRMELIEAVADAKLGDVLPFRDRQREDQIFQRVRRAAVEAGLDPHQVEVLYRAILELSLAHQAAHVRARGRAPLRVAYQGVEGAFSHLAAQQRYGGRPGGVLLTGCDTLRRAVEHLTTGEADFALLPIENSTAGSINESYDLLAGEELYITGEEVLTVEHCLLALPGTPLARVRTVISHPQALAQCAAFLRTLPGVQSRAEFDTAGAARLVREGGDPSLAAIASEAAARVFGLEVLVRGVQPAGGNLTRFVEVGRQPAACDPGAPCKTSLSLVLGHHPGALGEVLVHFGRRGINLTKLESRPIPGQPWRYRFYLDLEGHAGSEPVAAALSAIGEHVEELRMLGSYPASRPQAAATPSSEKPP